MRIAKQLTVHAPLARVWKIIAEDYDQVGAWASAVATSRENTQATSVNGSPVGGRICETTLGPFKETIRRYSPAEKLLEYSATGEKMPFFVRGLRGRWQLTDAGAHATRVSLEFNASLMFPFSLLMGWMMRIQFSKAINTTLEELVHYAQTGKIHARKVALLAAATRR
ncbi:MAG: SRPBCC family protein [Pseudomonadota bacterium]